MRRRLGIVFVGALAGAARIARADVATAPPNVAPLVLTPVERPTRSIVALDLDAGFGTPLGLVGVSIDVRPIRWVSLSGGGGFSIDGPQLGAMARLEPDLPVYFGVGTSFGPYVRDFCKDFGHLFPADGGSGQCLKFSWDRARWLNGEVGYSTGFREDVRLRAYIGVAALLGRTPSACASVSTNGAEQPCGSIDSSQSPSSIVYVGFGADWPP